jgi:hypothetical protein
MRQYHRIGIPTTELKPGETHLKHLKVFVVSHQKSQFGVEWMRFEADAAVPDLVRQVPYVAFEVTDFSSELAGREISGYGCFQRKDRDVRQETSCSRECCFNPSSSLLRGQLAHAFSSRDNTAKANLGVITNLRNK